ncbi:mu-class non-structural protein [Broome reovirus]|uniref:Mu-class non-structural protein n=1 Tax=Broome reovirus TaxID=667093 RepID=D6MM25_9REOV|nr:mu-class non-structural protein [Broome reovirus]ACU68605.1 mu-class non-structural protein [Broome reovirus]
MSKEKRVLKLPRRGQTSGSVKTEARVARSVAEPFVSAFDTDQSLIMHPEERLTLAYNLSDGGEVLIDDVLPISYGYLKNHQTVINSLASWLSDPNREWRKGQKDVCLIRKGMTLSEIINRIRRYVNSAYGIKMSDESMLAISDALNQEMLDYVVHSSASDVPIEETLTEEESISVAIERSLNSVEGRESCPDVERSVILDASSGDVKVLVSSNFEGPSAGRYNQEDYNESRGAFLGHVVHTLPEGHPPSIDFLARYLAIVPTSIAGEWRETNHIGELIYHPQDVFDCQTTFNTLVHNETLTLLAGDIKVAKYRLHDVTSILSGHAVARAAKEQSEYDRLSAKAMVLFFTPRAVEWAMQSGLTDSVFNGLHVRVCIGFDPFYTRMTQNGVILAATLLDDKFNLKSKQRMVRRMIPSRGNMFADDCFRRYYKGNWMRCGDFYSQAFLVREADEHGMAVLDVNYNHDERITNLKQRISELMTVEKPTPKPRSSVKNVLLQSYIEAHKCVNVTTEEQEKLRRVLPDLEVFNATLERRYAEYKRVVAKYESIGESRAQPTTDGLQSSVMNLEHSLSIYEHERMELKSMIDQMRMVNEMLESRNNELEKEIVSYEHALAVNAKKLHQVASSSARPGVDGNYYTSGELLVDPPDFADVSTTIPAMDEI